MRTTSTYATMAISQEAFNEISEKLIAAGYDHALIFEKDRGITLDMHGIGLTVEDLPQIGPVPPAAVTKALRHDARKLEIDVKGFLGTDTSADAMREHIRQITGE